MTLSGESDTGRIIGLRPAPLVGQGADRLISVRVVPSLDANHRPMLEVRAVGGGVTMRTYAQLIDVMRAIDLAEKDAEEDGRA